MMFILVVIIIFIALYIGDLYLQSQAYRLYEEGLRLFEELQKKDIQSFKQFQKLYGRDMDIIGHRTPADFPVSIYYNLKDLSTLGFLRARLIQIKMSWMDDTGKIQS